MAHSGEEAEDFGFDVNTGTVRKGRVLMQNTAIGPIFLSFGPEKGQSSKEYNEFFHAECDRILKIAERDGLLKSGYDPDQPRIPAGQSGGGEWTDGGKEDNADGAGTDSIQDIAAHWWATPEDKQRFVDAYLSDAQKVADDLHVPVENVLGIAALESTWGTSRFAMDGKNLFGMHAGASYSNRSMQAQDSDAEVAVFDSYADCFASFVKDKGWIVRGKADPTAFMTALQEKGKFGILDNGDKVPSYVKSSVATIRGLRPYIARRRI